MKKYTGLLLFTLMIWSFAVAVEIPILRKINLFSNISEKKVIPNIKICALRVEFQKDNDELTTGNGKFLYEAESHDTLCSFFKVDPVPHNRAYFKDHILALSNYYQKASNGNLTIDLENSEVYPIEDSKAYTVSQKMKYYNPFLEKDSINIRFSELYIEAIRVADSEVDFSNYDVVIVFHAGVGQDFAIDLDPTPYEMDIHGRRLGNGRRFGMCVHFEALQENSWMDSMYVH